jgi:hypothetical protein
MKENHTLKRRRLRNCRHDGQEVQGASEISNEDVRESELKKPTVQFLLHGRTSY